MWRGEAEPRTSTIQQLVITFFCPHQRLFGEGWGRLPFSQPYFEAFISPYPQHFPSVLCIVGGGGTQQTGRLIKNSTAPEYLLSSLPSRNGSSGQFPKDWISPTPGAGIRAMQIRLSSEITAVNNPQRHYLSKGKKQAARLNIQSAAVIYVSFTMIDGKG